MLTNNIIWQKLGLGIVSHGKNLQNQTTTYYLVNTFNTFKYIQNKNTFICVKTKQNNQSRKRMENQPVSENPSRAGYIDLCALAIQPVMSGLLLIGKHPSLEHELSMLGLLSTAHLYT